MTQQTVSLSEGGKVVIVGGREKDWSEYRKHPQLIFWSGEQKDVLRAVNNKDLPDNCKLLIISRFISHAQIEKVTEAARNKKIPIVGNKNDGQISEMLHDMVGPVVQTSNAIKAVSANGTQAKIEGRGKLKTLEPFINFSLSNQENGKILFAKAKELGIQTTENSVTQIVVKARREKSGGTVPKSVRNKLDVTVEMLDAIVKDISGMRDYLIELTEENRTLRKRVEKFKQALED